MPGRKLTISSTFLPVFKFHLFSQIVLYTTTQEETKEPAFSVKKDIVLLKMVIVNKLLFPIATAISTPLTKTTIPWSKIMFTKMGLAVPLAAMQ